MQSNSWRHFFGLARRVSLALTGAALLLAALLPGAAGTSGIAHADEGNPGALYVMTNAASGNAILAFQRGADGSLSPAGSFATGGLGSGAGLGSQGSVVLSQDQRWLFVVNAGSNEVSVVAVGPGGLSLVGTAPSGGQAPISLTAYGSLLYVLNAGGSGNITGFAISPQGQLSALAGSTRPLSNGGLGAAPGPAQISFSPAGSALVVTEKATNRIVTYAVGPDGLPSDPVPQPAAGVTPFGFAFGLHDTLVVSEAFGGAPNASAVSSYRLDGVNLQPVSPSAHTQQTAACWVAVTGDGRYAYTTNAGSGSVSGYAVAPDGTLTLLNADGRTGVTGDGSSPIDAAVSRNGRYLYVVTAGAHRVAAFQIGADGSLTAIGGVDLPAGALGLAVR